MAEKGLINLIHIGQFFAFKLYLWPISRSICILIFFCFRTGFKTHSRGPDFTIINCYYQPLSFPKHQQFLKIRLSFLFWVISSCLSLGSVVSFNQAQSLQLANTEKEEDRPWNSPVITRLPGFLGSCAQSSRSSLASSLWTLSSTSKAPGGSAKEQRTHVIFVSLLSMCWIIIFGPLVILHGTYLHTIRSACVLTQCDHHFQNHRFHEAVSNPTHGGVLSKTSALPHICPRAHGLTGIASFRLVAHLGSVILKPDWLVLLDVKLHGGLFWHRLQLPWSLFCRGLERFWMGRWLLRRVSALPTSNFYLLLQLEVKFT